MGGSMLMQQVKLEFGQGDLPVLNSMVEEGHQRLRALRQRRDAYEKLQQILEEGVAKQAAFDVCEELVRLKLLNKKEIFSLTEPFISISKAISKRLSRQLNDIVDAYENCKEDDLHWLDGSEQLINSTAQEIRWLQDVVALLSASSNIVTVELTPDQHEKLGMLILNIAYRKKQATQR